MKRIPALWLSYFYLVFCKMYSSDLCFTLLLRTCTIYVKLNDTSLQKLKGNICHTHSHNPIHPHCLFPSLPLCLPFWINMINTFSWLKYSHTYIFLQFICAISLTACSPFLVVKNPRCGLFHRVKTITHWSAACGWNVKEKETLISVVSLT